MSSGFEINRGDGNSQLTRRRRDASPAEETSAQRLANIRERNTRHLQPASAPREALRYPGRQTLEQINRTFQDFGLGAGIGASLATSMSTMTRGTMPTANELRVAALAGGISAVSISRMMDPNIDAAENTSQEEQSLRHEGRENTGEQSLRHEGRENTGEQSLRHEGRENTGEQSLRERMRDVVNEINIVSGVERATLIPDLDSHQWKEYAAIAYYRITRKQTNFKQENRYMLIDIINGATNPNPPFSKTRDHRRYKRMLMEVIVDYQEYLRSL